MASWVVVTRAPPPREQTDTTENVKFLQTMYAGGKYGPTVDSLFTSNLGNDLFLL